MDVKQIGLLSIAAVAVGSAAFEAGREVATVRSRENRSVQVSAISWQTSPARPKSSSDLIDLTKARIPNIAVLPFEQAFDLLSHASRDLLQKWARELDALPAGSQKHCALAVFYKTLAQLDPPTAFSLALLATEERSGNTPLRIVLDATPTEAMPVLAEKFDDIAPDKRQYYISEIISRWAQIDPVSTSQFFERHINDVDDYDFSALMMNWGAIDPPAALAWLDRQHLNAELAPHAINGLVTGWSDIDRGAAVAYLIGHESDERFQKAIDVMSGWLFQKYPEEARDFVLRLQDEGARNVAVGGITTASCVSPIHEWDRTADVIAKWLITLPRETWSNHMGGLALTWIMKDRQEFFGWVNQLVPADRNQILSEYCLTEVNTLLPEAVVVSQQINDRELREHTARELLGRSGKSRDELLAMLKTMDLKPSQLSALAMLIPVE